MAHPPSWRHHAIRSHGSHQRAVRSASSRQRLDLGSIFGAKHQSSRTPPVERHGTPRTDTTRTGRQQQGRAPNQDKRRLGARQQRQPSRGRGTRGPRSIGLLMNNELCAGGGVGRCCWLADGPGDWAAVQADVAWGTRNGVQLCPCISGNESADVLSHI